MTQRDRDRLAALKIAKKGLITRRQAGAEIATQPQLGLGCREIVKDVRREFALSVIGILAIEGEVSGCFDSTGRRGVDLDFANFHRAFAVARSMAKAQGAVIATVC